MYIKVNRERKKLHVDTLDEEIVKDKVLKVLNFYFNIIAFDIMLSLELLFHIYS